MPNMIKAMYMISNSTVFSRQTNEAVRIVVVLVRVMSVLWQAEVTRPLVDQSKALWHKRGLTGS